MEITTLSASFFEVYCLFLIISPFFYTLKNLFLIILKCFPLFVNLIYKTKE
ncbi:Uncharacterized protein dnm_080730 [Desulfonema magnum]|uniref:Uncharacterized protein n=1 Tax=Desulfonema magnum TaxID=45655 RepID=A0A975BUD1_9BACT|nr:Uncharacterized protein dnm_080730 [Desulfonema magnum]